jgi:hypothetical protein
MVQELPNRYVRICVGVRRKPCVKGVVQANSPSSASLRMVMAVKLEVPATGLQRGSPGTCTVTDTPFPST